MLREQFDTMKSPFNARRPFPWQCHRCGKNDVNIATIEYTAEMKYDGRLYTFPVPSLKIPICQSCGNKVFTEDVDKQINDALRSYLKLLTPEQIQGSLQRLNLSQKELTNLLGIAEATLSRWINESQIQSKSMDTLLRIFFAFPGVRNVLLDDVQKLDLGLSDYSMQDCSNAKNKSTEITVRTYSPKPPSHWLNSFRDKSLGAQEKIQRTHSTWALETHL